MEKNGFTHPIATLELLTQAWRPSQPQVRWSFLSKYFCCFILRVAVRRTSVGARIVSGKLTALAEE